MSRRASRSTLFPYTTLFRSGHFQQKGNHHKGGSSGAVTRVRAYCLAVSMLPRNMLTEAAGSVRSEEHTSELQSHSDLVCRLLLEKKKPILTPCIAATCPAHS